MSKQKFAYHYEFTFVQDEAGRPYYCKTAAFSFMQAYSWALQKLKTAKKSKARLYKLEEMHRSYRVPV